MADDGQSFSAHEREGLCSSEIAAEGEHEVSAPLAQDPLITEKEIETRFERYDQLSYAKLTRVVSEASSIDNASRGEASGKLLPYNLLSGDCTTGFERIFPIVKVAKIFSRESLVGDVVAGCTVAVVLIPQAIAYALLANLPPAYGLYCSITPLLVFALTTTSRHTCIGPFALVSLLVADLVGEALPDAEGDAYIDAVMLLSFMTGMVQIGLAAVRGGVVVSFLADPVVSAFTTGAAVLIMSSQLKHLLGIHLPSTSFVYMLIHLFPNLLEINVATLVCGILAAAGMHYSKEYNQKHYPKFIFPEQLAAVVVFALLSWALDLSGWAKVATVGAIGADLPQIKVPHIHDLPMARALVQPAIIVAIVSYMVTVSIANSFAAKHKHSVDAGQELVALGCSNLVGSFFQAYPASGSFSRTAVASASGTHTQLHGVVQAVLVALALLLLMPLMSPLPYSVLAAIVVMALRGLLDFTSGRRLWHVSKGDFVLWLITFCTTVLFGVQVGIVCGMVASMLWLIKQSSRPFWAELGRLPGTHFYRNVRRYKDAQRLPGIIILRFDAPLHFANREYFRSVIQQREASFHKHQAESSDRNQPPEGVSTEAHTDQPSTQSSPPSVPLLCMVLDASGISGMDASGTNTLRSIVEDQQKRDPPVELILSGQKGPLRQSLRKSGIQDLLGGHENFFIDIHDAVADAERRVNVYLQTRIDNTI